MTTPPLLTVPPENVQAPAPVAAAPVPFLATLPSPLAGLAVFTIMGATIALVRAGSGILNPLLLALFLVTLALPAARWLQRRGWQLRAAQAVAALLLLIGVVALVGLVGFSLGRVAGSLGTLRMQIAGSVEDALPFLGDNADNVAATAAVFFTVVISAMGRTLVNLLYALFVAIFLLFEAPTLGRLLKTSLKDLPFLGVVPQTMDATVRFMGVRAVLNALVAAGFTLLFWLVGVEQPLLWGLLAFVLGFVPYIGLPLAAAPPVLLVLVHSGLRTAIAVAAGIVVVNFLVEYGLAPMLTGKSLSLSPAVVLVSFVFWMFILGPLGALFAVPLTVWLFFTFDQSPSTRWAASIISGRDT